MKAAPLAVLGVLVGITLLAGEASASHHKADVCHQKGKGNGSYKLINVSRKAVPAHLRHGDAEPGDLVGDAVVAEDCSLNEVQRVDSGPLGFGPGGWGGISCPAGTSVIGGGYEPEAATVQVSEAAETGSASGLYPVYPHYAFPVGETGWVVQNDNDGETITVYALCA